MKRLLWLGLFLIPLFAWAIAPKDIDKDPIGSMRGHCLKSGGAGDNYWGDCIWAGYFADLLTSEEDPENPVKVCYDCTYTNPCEGGGAGALAVWLHNHWTCNGDSATPTTTTTTTTL
jgi:hypothetical protein